MNTPILPSSSSVSSRLLRVCFTTAFLVVAIALFQTLSAAQPAGERPSRAAAPKFDATDGDEIFFANALEEGLKGDRPSHLGKKPAGAAGSSSPGVIAGMNGGAATKGGGWARLISAETIEDTIKSTKLQLDKTITQPAAFASGGNRAARRQFVILTAMFAIISEFDGDVRWKSDATAARERCRNAAGVCKVGSVQAYNAAKATKDDLADLVGGNTLPAGEATANNWPELTDRSTLMQQLETLYDDLIQPAVSNDTTFKSQADELLVAAELSSAIAEILMKEDMEDAGDDDYDVYCKQIQTAAKDIVDAIKQSNGGAARTASGAISKACSECHELYRG